MNTSKPNSRPKLQAVRGFRDYFAEQMQLFRSVEERLRQIVTAYGFEEIVTPVLEPAALFEHNLGEATDLVTKEMYVFEDRGGDRLVLRPEGTASCVRAGLESGKFYNQKVKWFYLEPMFRHERPQRGRYRQFYQFGLELFNYLDVAIDAELLQLTSQLLAALPLKAQPILKLNSLGDAATRLKYRQELTEFFNKNLNLLTEQERSTLAVNPLRLLDSKREELKTIVNEAPSILDALSLEAAKRWERLQLLLHDLAIPFEVDSHLVRGLDYYNDMVFEWTASLGGSELAIGGGGRYDQLISNNGGASTPAVGFAFGFERLLELVDDVKLTKMAAHKLKIFGIALDIAAQPILMKLAAKLRAEDSYIVEMDHSLSDLKKQLKRANAWGAQVAIIIGENELNKGCCLVKNLVTGEQQETANIDRLKTWLSQLHQSKN